jgi:hypothetical protein
MIPRPDTRYVLYKVMTKNSMTHYVIATDPAKAYSILRKFLDDNDLYFSAERDLKLIEPIASNDYYAHYEILLMEDGVGGG